MKYIKMYADQAAYDADNGKEYPHVGYIEGTDEVIYMNEPDWSKEYLTFEALESGTFRYKVSGANEDMYYSIDGGNTWTGLGSSIDTPTINAGETIMFKRTKTGGAGSRYYVNFTSSGAFNVMGNPFSIIKSDFRTSTSDNNMYCLQRLFSGCTNLVSAENLSLQHLTSFQQSIFMDMFRDCTSLTTPPKLPRIVTEACYKDMFRGCTSLTTAPELPATTLIKQCYQEMFYGCTSLNYIKMLATDISADRCLDGWVNGVAQSGTFVKNASMSSLPSGASGIPTNWTVVDAT